MAVLAALCGASCCLCQRLLQAGCPGTQRTLWVVLLQPRRVAVEHEAAAKRGAARRQALCRGRVQVQLVGLCGWVRRWQWGQTVGASQGVKCRQAGRKQAGHCCLTPGNIATPPRSSHPAPALSPVSVLSLSNTTPWKPAAASAPQSTHRMSGTARCGSASGRSLCGAGR